MNHVVARGNNRALIFFDDDDRRKYLRLLDGAVARTGWVLLAYCLMPNHVHLLIETPEPKLADGMRWLHGHYGRFVNDRHDRVGHIFQGRYKARRQLTDHQLERTRAYIALNPHKAKLVRPGGHYRWARDLVGPGGFAPGKAA